jgi:chromate transporter
MRIDRIDSVTAPANAPDELRRPASPAELFITFTLIALQGFGGVIAIIQRALCENKRWMTPVEFVELFALSQVLPGPNVINLSLILGDRFFGWRGAAAALAGMILAPLVIVLTLATLYMHYADSRIVAGTLRGMGAVAVGLIFGTAIKLSRTLRANVMGLPVCIALGAVSFLAIAWFQFPLVWVLLAVGAVGGVFAWRRLGQLETGAANPAAENPAGGSR